MGKISFFFPVLRILFKTFTFSKQISLILLLNHHALLFIHLQHSSNSDLKKSLLFRLILFFTMSLCILKSNWQSVYENSILKLSLSPWVHSNYNDFFSLSQLSGMLPYGMKSLFYIICSVNKSIPLWCCFIHRPWVSEIHNFNLGECQS